MTEKNRSFEREDAYRVLETTNMWINNFDTKASIILGSIGIIFTIVLSSDFTETIKNITVKWFEKINIGSIFFSLSIILCVIGILFLIFTIMPRVINSTNAKKLVRKKSSNQKNFFKSMMFYGNIALMKYDEYKNFVVSRSKSYDEIMDDLVFQIYNASCICYDKFRKLKFGSLMFIVGFSIYSIQLIIGYYCFF